ncbi:MAG: glycerol-3-phosphate dehydrogenase/oxidase, partial [Spirochaetota bacterium]
MERAAILDGLARDNAVEVLVIGAGINGIGVFRDLALQGVGVLLVDRGDFCSGASATSSHMAHGGIRYLENGEFRLVEEAVNERNRLIRNAPHLVKPLPTVIPIYKLFSGLLNAPFKFLNLLDRPSERGGLVIKIGLMFYDALTRGQRVVPRHRFEGRKASLARFPALSSDIAFTASYYDGQLVSPERLALELVIDGEAEGKHARALNYATVVGVNAVRGEVLLRDEIAGGEFPVRPRVIINAAGPWIDLVNAKLGKASDYIGGTKGSHIILDHPGLRAAIGGNEFFFENRDGRIVLLLPWFDRVIIGTSDLPIEDPDSALCEEAEIDYFIGLTSRVFPGIKVGREHIVFTFSGVRPLTRSDATLTGQISRDNSLRENSLGTIPVLSLVGGKWTTFRAFAEQ